MTNTNEIRKEILEIIADAQEHYNDDPDIYADQIMQLLAKHEESSYMQGRIYEMESQARFLRRLMGIIDKPWNQDPKETVRIELVSTQNGIKYFKEQLTKNTQEGEYKGPKISNMPSATKEDLDKLSKELDGETDWTK